MVRNGKVECLLFISTNFRLVPKADDQPLIKTVVCPNCLIEDPEVIKKILTHLNEKTAQSGMNLLPDSRAPPPAELFNLS